MSGWADSGLGNLSQRLAYGLRRLIDAGLLAPGSPLPPERRLAEELAVSRSTVTTALDVLRAEGVLTSHQGRGTFVADAAEALDEEASNRMAVHLIAGAGGIDLAVGNPADVSHLPPVSIDLADLLACGAGPGFQPLGLPALRTAIADMHTALGVVTDAEEVHVTSGAHQAIALAVTALAARREPIAAETPGYPGFFDILEGTGHRFVPLRADRAGILPESLEAALGTGGARVVYVQAGAQNPTGVVTSPSRLRTLAAILDEHDAVVIEDATLAELVFAGRPPTDLARLCRRATVVSVGSFSKVLWGGLRVGWLRAPLPVIDRTLHRRLTQDLGAVDPVAAADAGPAAAPRRDRRAGAGPSSPTTSSAARRCCAPRSRSGRCRIRPAVRRCGSTPGCATPMRSSRSPTASVCTWRRGRSPSRGGAPIPTCGSASIGRGRSSTPACAASARRGASSAGAAASPGRGGG